MNDKYIYRGAPEERVFGPLPAGDYSFKIVTAEAPYQKNDHWVMRVQISIEPSGLYVYANPWSGVDKNGEHRDGIAELLHCVNRIPKEGYEPNWDGLVGTRGRCRLKTEVAQVGTLAGQQRNVVAFWHRPKELDSAHTSKPLERQERDELDVEPDNIPF